MCKHISHSLQQDLGDAFLRKKDILQYLNDLMMDKQGNNAVLYQKDKRSRWSRNCELKTVSVFWQTDSHAVRLCFIKCGCRGISKPWSVFFFKSCILSQFIVKIPMHCRSPSLASFAFVLLLLAGSKGNSSWIFSIVWCGIVWLTPFCTGLVVGWVTTS